MSHKSKTTIHFSLDFFPVPKKFGRVFPELFFLFLAICRAGLALDFSRHYRAHTFQIRAIWTGKSLCIARGNPGWVPNESS